MSNLNYNQCIFAGRLCAEPELKQTQSGKYVAQFRMAINRPQREGVESQSDFISCIAWEKRAEFLAKYFHKGSAIFVTGRMQTRSWQDDSGAKHFATECIADDFRFVDSRNDLQGVSTSCAPHGAPTETLHCSSDNSAVTARNAATAAQGLPQAYGGESTGFEALETDENLPF